MEEHCKYERELATMENDISYLKERDRLQNGKIDKIYSATNKILGGVAVACVLLAINALLIFYGG